jgi:hypothetical protein
MPSDAAARVVAIAAGEMVRVQARAEPRPPPPPPVTPLPDASRSQLALGSSAVLLWLPEAEPELLAGPELRLEHRLGAAGQALFGRWLVGGSGERTERWLEIGAEAALRLELGEGWRARFGVQGGAAALAITDAVAFDGVPSEEGSTWTARHAGALAIERELVPGAWLGLTAEPGASLRSQSVDAAGGARSEIGGFALGAALTLAAEPRIYSN